MKLPFLQSMSAPQERDVMEFKGINFNSVRADGEMADMHNLSCDEYPTLTQRNGRKSITAALDNPTNILVKTGKLAYVANGHFIYDGIDKGTLAANEKQMCSVGNRIIIFPDKKYYDTVTDAFGSLGYAYTQVANDLTFTATTITSLTTNFTGFLAGDAIKISGCTTKTANNKFAVIKSISGKVLTFDENMFTACTEAGLVTLAREIPDMDFVCEYNNRLWGCKGNLVYASKQGDPFNFNVYKGVSTDSYALEVGTDGKFTGISGYTSHLVLFKENCIHKLYGTKPANFQLSTSQCSGLKIGSEKSIAVLNDTIFYQSKLGIMAYTGNIPELISKNFGARVYSEANAGTDGEKYYVSLKNGAAWDFLVFDTKHNIWIKEDHTKAWDFAFLNGKLIFLSGDDNKIYQCNADDSAENFVWDADFGESAEYMKDKKAPMKFYIHAEMQAGSTLTVRLNCDRQGWQDIYYAGFAARKTIKIPVAPKRCDVFALQVAGRGRCKIFSISRSFTARGDNNAS